MMKIQRKCVALFCRYGKKKSPDKIIIVNSSFVAFVCCAMQDEIELQAFVIETPQPF